MKLGIFAALVACTVALTSAAGGSSSTHAVTAGGRRIALPPDVWAIVFDRTSIAHGTLTGLRALGFNSVVLDGAGVASAARARIRREAQAQQLLLIEIAPAKQCRAVRRRGALCATTARTLARAGSVAGSRGSDLLVVRVGSPARIRRLGSSVGGRVLAIASLGATAGPRWAEAIGVSKSDAALDLAVAPTSGGRALASYSSILRRLREADLYVAPTGSDAGQCTRTTPCASLDRAYRVARPGQVVELGGGDYRDQQIDVDASKVNAKADVVFRPAAGAVVTMDRLRMFGSHAVFRGEWHPDGTSSWRLRHLSSDSTEGPLTSGYVAFENLQARSFFVGSNHHITIRDSTFGPSYICSPGNPAEGLFENRIGGGQHTAGQVPHRIVLDGIVVRDQNSGDIRGCHTGGLQFVSGDGVTIRNSTFSQTAIYDISIGSSSGVDNPRNVTIENNWFGAPVEALPLNNERIDSGELQFSGRGGTWTNWLIRFNSFRNGISLKFGDPTPFVNVRIIGNVAGGAPDCTERGVAYAYNAWLGGRCSSTDRTLRTLPYRKSETGQEDFHLVPGVAQDLVRGTGPDFRISADIDGEQRPRGAARDAGADER